MRSAEKLRDQGRIIAAQQILILVAMNSNFYRLLKSPRPELKVQFFSRPQLQVTRHLECCSRASDRCNGQHALSPGGIRNSHQRDAAQRRFGIYQPVTASAQRTPTIITRTGGSLAELGNFAATRRSAFEALNFETAADNWLWLGTGRVQTIITLLPAFGNARYPVALRLAICTIECCECGVCCSLLLIPASLPSRWIAGKLNVALNKIATQLQPNLAAL